MPNWGILVKKIGLGIAEKMLKEVGLRGDRQVGDPCMVEGSSVMKGLYSHERL
jgi:hypothetical protein